MYNEILKRKDAEVEWWRQAYLEQTKRGDSQELINRENMEIAKTALAVLKGVQSAADRVQP
jgi:hypothetical protein